MRFQTGEYVLFRDDVYGQSIIEVLGQNFLWVQLAYEVLILVDSYFGPTATGNVLTWDRHWVDKNGISLGFNKQLVEILYL